MCIKNPGYPASLETGKIYRRLSDRAAETQGMLRIVDESGEDYLHARENFLPIELPKAVRDALSIAS